jgi:adenosylhomocysteinase
MTRALRESVAMSGLSPLSQTFERMPLLSSIRDRYARTLPLRGCRIAVVFHLTKEAACLAQVLRAGGADVCFVPSKIPTIERPAADELSSSDILLLTADGEEDRVQQLRKVPVFRPDLIVDNSDLFSLWHRLEDAPPLLCATMHSRSACDIVESYWEAHRRFLFPVIAVGSSPIKLQLESFHGTGQSVVTALIRTTGLQLGGKKVVIIGYGNVGGGIARFARGLNARVAVVMNSASRALHAVMDGFEVLPLIEALSCADVVITATGRSRILTEGHFLLLRDGVFLGNVGRAEEIDVLALSRIADTSRIVSDTITEYTINGHRIRLLGGGHQFNHMAGCGNSSEIMDLSLALHALSLEHVWCERPRMTCAIHQVSQPIADTVAQEKLNQLGIRLGVQS